MAGTLATTHTGRPGLPRGRASLPARAVRAAQRERLLRAVTAASAELGYAEVTVADVVRRARVSRNAFYQHFAGKEECFIAACDAGCELMFERVLQAARDLPESAGGEERLRAAVRAYLEFVAGEPEFARTFNLDILAAGPRAMSRRTEVHERFADMWRRWHARARRENPSWPAVPEDAYAAMVGSIYELVVARVRDGRTGELPELEGLIAALHLAVFAADPGPLGALSPEA